MAILINDIEKAMHDLGYDCKVSGNESYGYSIIFSSGEVPHADLNAKLQEVIAELTSKKISSSIKPRLDADRRN